MKNGKVRKLVKDAGYWLRLASKVYNYRHDILNEKQLKLLQAASHELELSANQQPVEEKKLRQSTDNLKKILKSTGGSFFRRSSWAENVETFLVVAILAIGVRTFFFQPFKIPTNSMYPTYNGMTFKVYGENKSKPHIAKRIGNWILFGATHYEVSAPASGELLLPLFSQDELGEFYGYFKNERARRRSLLFFLGPRREYTFFIDKTEVNLSVPADFSVYKVLREKFAPESLNMSDWLTAKGRNGSIIYESGIPLLKTGAFFKKGDTVLAFDILTGDALFVDRLSYNFSRPKIGDPFVFRTRNIPELTRMNGGQPDDKYYIKRLVGKGGDTLEIKESVLLRNGNPIEGADAFVKNANRTDEYEGYTNIRRLSSQSKENIPQDHYYAMGDNSDESSDSRYFGYVPSREVVGKAIFIYYPFSNNWGSAE